MKTGFFTSESVSEGHPDKLADRISDAVLDAYLQHDQSARVACETMVKSNTVVLAGEVSSSAEIDLETVVRNRICDTGYDDEELGFDGNSCRFINLINQQSQEIAQGVDRPQAKRQGAGDQGLMFGYASNETESFMPAPIRFAHSLVRRQAEQRRQGALAWLRPDAKSQVTMRYEQGKPVAIDSVVLSTQHDPDIAQKELHRQVMEHIIRPALPSQLLREDTCYHINPTGCFVKGGPEADCGLTGRKIIVDTYGGMARHGGGAFSGKDPSKVDRSASYFCRYMAKNLVAAGLSERCEIQLCYAIGVAEPLALQLECFGSNRLAEAELSKLLREHFDCTPYGIVKALDLCRPIYTASAAYGHFGREDEDFPWERLDKVAALRRDAGISEELAP